MMKMIRWFVLIFLSIAAPDVAFGQSKPPRPLFADDSPLHLVLRGPIAAIGGSKVPLDATLSTVGATKAETIAVQISARGITRRQHDICSFPPIRVDFPAKPGPDSLFAKQKSLKLVTHCQGSVGFQQYVLLEYAAYKMYALLTPMSFDTRLVTVDYIDRNGRPIVTRQGFFIEDIDDVARRNGVEAYKTTARVGSAYLSPRDAARDALFQMMIGNLDWAMNAGPAGANCCHNSKLIGVPNKFGGLVPVPYDYDFSGLVDAPYATPPEGITIANVRERRYRGFCRTNAEAAQLAPDFRDRRAALIGVLDTVPALEERSRQKARSYLIAFFDQIASPGGMDRMMATCIR